MDNLEIKLQRVRLGYTQKQVSEMMGMKPYWYSHRELGVKKLKAVEKIKLAKILKFSFQQMNDYLFDGELVELRNQDTGDVCYAVKLPE